MKIANFVELTKTKGWLPIAVNDQNEKIKTALNVKPYLGIKAKKELVNDIVNNVLKTRIYTSDNGLRHISLGKRNNCSPRTMF